MKRLIAVVTAALLSLAACGPSPQAPQSIAPGGEWREFEGTWTAAGNRHTIRLGDNHRAAIAQLTGSLLLSGPSRPALGFRAEVITFFDSTTGMVGRAVWTDERGDQAYSELRGEGNATGNRVVGTFIGGTGRYRGVTGTYEFAWKFVLESEEGMVQGQSVGFKGRARVEGAPAKP